MAIQISGTNVIDNSRNLVNIQNANVSTAATVGKLDVTGLTTSLHLQVTGFTTTSNQSITGVATIGTLAVTGLTNSLHLNVTGLTTNNNLNVTGFTTITNESVTGVSTIGRLAVTGLTTTLHLNISGFSTCFGLTTTRHLNVTGFTTIRNQSIVGISTVTGGIAINPITENRLLTNSHSLIVEPGNTVSNVPTVVINNRWNTSDTWDATTDTSRSAVHIDVEYNQDNGYGIIQPLPDWKNNNLVLEKGKGDYQPGSIIRGRIYDDGGSFFSTLATLYDNGYCNMYPNTTSERLSSQITGFGPASNYLQHGVLNSNTIITGAAYSPYLAREFGAGGTGRIGYCYITYGGDVVIRAHWEAGAYYAAGENQGTAYNDPGQAVQTIMDAPLGAGVTVAMTPYDYATIGVATDNQNFAFKDASRDVLGKVVKVSGNIDSKTQTSEFFCQTQNGYVWATTEHNTYGFLNKGNTTNIQLPTVVWDVGDDYALDKYVGNSLNGGYEPKYCSNITGTHDMCDDSDNTGTVYYLKVAQETNGYHELWNTGGYNAYGQLADGTVTNRTFAKACIFHAADQITAEPGVTTTGTYVQSNDGINVGVAGTFIRVSFTGGTDPALYLGEYIYLDFTSGTAVDDTYQVINNHGSGVYSVIRHTGLKAYTMTSLTTNGNFQMMGRSQLLRKLNRTIHGQWSGGGNYGICYVQDSSNDLWFVGETSSGAAGEGNITIDRRAFKNISGLSTTNISGKNEEVLKLSIVGTDAGFQDTFIWFADYTLWHAGKNTSGYSYGNLTQKNTWSQIAGPGYASTGPDGLVYNFWIRERSSGGAASVDSLYVVDYTNPTGYMVWCCGENGGYQLCTGGTVDNSRWITPTTFPSGYGTSTSKSPTTTGWIPEQMWPTSQGGSGGHGFIAMMRNLSTNEYRIYAWGYNASGLLGIGAATTPTKPVRLNLGVPAYKIKDLKVFARDTNYDGIGLMITYDGEIFGIGGARYAATTYPLGHFWSQSDGAPRYFHTWVKINPLNAM